MHHGNHDAFDFLATFKPISEIPLGSNSSLLLYHGSPRSNVEEILATTSPEQLDVLLDGQHATVMAGGHTHLQMLPPGGCHPITQTPEIRVSGPRIPRNRLILGELRGPIPCFWWGVFTAGFVFDFEAFVDWDAISVSPFQSGLFSGHRRAGARSTGVNSECPGAGISGRNDRLAT